MAPFRRIHIVINPAAGGDEPALGLFNRVFAEAGVAWSVSVTNKSGDAAEQARAALAGGAQLVAGYGGDGTLHELANVLAGSGVPLGILPGGTGNAFAAELGIPNQLEPAARLLCGDHRIRRVDTVRALDRRFVLRAFIGLEPEEQATREMKERYGILAYAITYWQRWGAQREIPYRLTVDDEVIEMPAMLCYVLNSGQTGGGFNLGGRAAAVDDGLVDVILLNLNNMQSIMGALERVLGIEGSASSLHYWRGRQIAVETEPDQAVWLDGEYAGRTPAAMEVCPLSLDVVAPCGDEAEQAA